MPHVQAHTHTQQSIAGYKGDHDHWNQNYIAALNISYSKNIFDVKKGEPKKVQVTERLKSVKSL